MLKFNRFPVRVVLKRPFSGRSGKGRDEDEERKKVGIILSGCGVLDGAEIHEATAMSFHISKLNLEPVFYAPKILQADVVDHETACATAEMRCAFKEAARIARGRIKPLANLTHCDCEAIAFPGGLGITKTLTDFETCDYNCSVDSEVMRVMEEYRDAEKPMAFACIAAILPARVFPGSKVTLGKRGDPCKWPHYRVIDSAVQMGAVIEQRGVDGYTFDRQNLIFTTPAFMFAGTFYQIFEGIGNMMDNMYKIMK